MQRKNRMLLNDRYLGATVGCLLAFGASLWAPGLCVAQVNTSLEEAVLSAEAETACIEPFCVTGSPACSDTKIREICATASNEFPKVTINCSVDFHRRDCEDVLGTPNKITKMLVFIGSAANGVLFDCAGGQIYAGPESYNYRRDGTDNVLITSRFFNGRWDRPADITIRDCEITGAVRILGMFNVDGEATLRDSSYLPGHVERARLAAPTRITLDRVKIIGTGRTPLYLRPGVTHVQLLDSEVTGEADKAGIYFDAETAFNTVRGNRIHVDTKDGDLLPHDIADRGWPQLALDASSHNTILNNHFSSLDEGGIYLYRNCGERGVVRHSTPSHNVIVNNTFYYDKYKGDDPAVYLGSRDYDNRLEEKLSVTCEDDERASPRVGSAASNADHATHNVVMQNQFYRRTIHRPFWPDRSATLDDMIRSEDWSDNSPNYIDHNDLVTDQTVEEDRLAGCYLPHDDVFVPHGTRAELMQDRDRDRACYSRVDCNDGESTGARSRDCRILRVSFTCRSQGDNQGCSEVARCPAEHHIVGARAACNLESGRIGEAQVSDLPFNRIAVLRASDRVADGECTVNRRTLSSGSAVLRAIQSVPRVTFGCREQDSNGGDCHVLGSLYCQRTP